mgnify:FL=1
MAIYFLLRRYRKIIIEIIIGTMLKGGAADTMLETLKNSGDLPDYVLLSAINNHKEEIKNWAENIDPETIKKGLHKLDILLGTQKE